MGKLAPNAPSPELVVTDPGCTLQLLETFENAPADGPHPENLISLVWGMAQPSEFSAVVSSDSNVQLQL